MMHELARGAPPLQRHDQRLQCQVFIDALAHRPADEFATEQVKY
jgi:hypothetical protein